MEKKATIAQRAGKVASLLKMKETPMRKSFMVMLALGLLSGGVTAPVQAQVTNGSNGGPSAHAPRVTVFHVPSAQSQLGVGIDYEHAQPLDLPLAPSRSESEAQADLIGALVSPMIAGEAGVSEGQKGNGKTNPVTVGESQASSIGASDVTPQEFGTNNHPFSTARADFSYGTNTTYPFRASGKLFFNIGSSTYVCSASLIKRGVVVTAAHCVANFGQSQFYTNWQFIPGYRNGVAPYAVWTVRSATVLTSYFNGTDSCAVSGIVCQDDVAVLLLNTSATGTYPGTSTGWYGYGWNGYGFTGGGLTQITQIGYPVCLDNGLLMEKNDSYGYKSASNSNNTVIGTLMCGGSSGGPWLVNFGYRPTLTGTVAGTASAPNTVVGVTSWGYTSTSPKESGASPFLSTNIVPLVNTACSIAAGACS